MKTSQFEHENGKKHRNFVQEKYGRRRRWKEDLIPSAQCFLKINLLLNLFLLVVFRTTKQANQHNGKSFLFSSSFFFHILFLERIMFVLKTFILLFPPPSQVNFSLALARFATKERKKNKKTFKEYFHVIIYKNSSGTLLPN